MKTTYILVLNKFGRKKMIGFKLKKVRSGDYCVSLMLISMPFKLSSLRY